MPKASILIRTYNEAKHIGNLLDAIARQRERDFEIILVDSGSTDETLSIAKGDVDRVLEISSRDFTFGYSLNAGCRVAQGEFVVIVSAHCLPTSSRWLESLLEPFGDSSVAMVYGRHIGARTTKFSEGRDFAVLFPPDEQAPRPYPYYAMNANAAIRRSLWQQRPFEERLTGLEDIAWARACHKQGMKIIYAPAAAVEHIHEESWVQIFNRYRREAAAARAIGLPHPPHGSRKVLPSLWQAILDLRSLLLSFLSHSGLVVHFRFEQWRGTRAGSRHEVNLSTERSKLFFAQKKNKAVVIRKKEEAHVEDRPMPELKPGDVLIQVSHVGICRTDLEVFDGVLGYYQNGMASYPIVPGHEFSGTIAELGANVRGLAVGDLVVGECILSCGTCPHCQKGSHSACKDRREVGVMNYDGAYASFIALPAHRVHKIPEGLSLKAACLAEPLAVVLRALRRAEARFTSTDRVAVVGAGPIGNLVAQVLAKRGRNVTVFNRSPHRLSYLNGTIATSQRLQGLDQFDAIVEASGNVEALQAVLEQSRSDATMVLLGFPYGKLDFQFEDLVGREKVIVGSVGGASEDFRAALDLLPTLHTAPFTEVVLPLSDFQKAWELHRSSKHLKVLLSIAPVEEIRR